MSKIDKLLGQLDGIDPMNVEECFLDSHLYAEAAATIRALEGRIAELELDTSIFHIKIEQLISMVKPLVVMGDDDSIFLTERQLGFIDGVRAAAALNQPKESGK